MNAVVFRVVAGTSLALMAGVGLVASGWARRESEVRVQARTVNVDPPHTVDDDRIAFVAGVEADARLHGLEGFTPEQLGAPQAYTRLLETPIVLAPGKTWRSGPLTLTLVVEKATYQKLGAKVTARHTVARLHNGGPGPLAYRIGLTSAERGRCDVRGARVHNAMALEPGETAEIVVCTGSEAARIESLEILEITPLGYVYLSKLPPQAIGLDATTAAAHRPLSHARLCNAADHREAARFVAQRTAGWVDVADFYSRHDCGRYRYDPAYRHTPGAPVDLPAVHGSSS